ncbi:MFS transporter [Falsirhodobacter halotolerans]|uniref:MFS transporter n=1 Tax=Falsirhodobacter halotolerans TaxID=1146892 RepID=UPI001FD226E9|nr:MFS transporter [Falsirhodobacter halotolerans]MCJ8139668.1 MFS transporter [Falsirhodobacter halotolerans]
MTPARRSLGQFEFIALMATLMAAIAFSIDAMLPAFPQMTAELTPDAPNHVQLIVVIFMLGMGLGTLLVGPISDAVGRKPVIIACAGIYCTGALIAALSQSLEMLLIGRLIQGIGGAGPRVVAIAIVRDLYAGRDMARVVSFIMMIFTIVPAMAPMIGNVVIQAFGWRELFFVFMLVSLGSALWLHIRQPETLVPTARRPLRLRLLAEGLREIRGNRMVVMTITAQGFAFACMFSTISSIQPIFEQRFDAAETFPYWFFGLAMVAGCSSFLNANIVGRVGMRAVITTVVEVQFAISAIMAVTNGFGLMPEALAFPAQIFWTASTFAMLGLCMGNLNALTLEPLGHLAGLGASISGCIATLMAVVLSLPVGQSFNGTNVPLATGLTVFTALILIIMWRLPKRQ